MSGMEFANKRAIEIMDSLEKEFYCEWKKEEIKKFEEKWQILIRMMENRKASFEEISNLKNEKEKIFSKISNYK